MHKPQINKKKSDLYNKLKGFTLAEVLITLGIIGVVAAMTIPILMQNIQDETFKQAWKREYSIFSQAYAQILSDNGGSIKNAYTAAGYATDTINMITLFKNNLSTINYCQSTSATIPKCWHAYPSYGVDSLAVHDKQGNLVTFWGAGYPAMILNDGTLAMFYAGDFNCATSFWGQSNTCVEIAIDVNGQKSPNVIGRDIYIIKTFENKLLPVGANDTIKNTCDTSGYSCAAEYLYK